MIGIQRKKFFGILLGHLPKTPITYSRASCKVGPKHELYLGWNNPYKWPLKSGFSRVTKTLFIGGQFHLIYNWFLGPACNYVIPRKIYSVWPPRGTSTISALQSNLWPFDAWTFFFGTPSPTHLSSDQKPLWHPIILIGPMGILIMFYYHLTLYTWVV